MGITVAADEATYAICALLSLLTFDGMDLMRLRKAEEDNLAKILTHSAVFVHEQMHARNRRAMSVSPKQWLGDANDPMNHDVQKRKSDLRAAFLAEGGR